MVDVTAMAERMPTPSDRQFERGMREAQRVADIIWASPERFRGDNIVIPFSAITRRGPSAFSRERLRVLVMLRDHGPFESLDALASALARPKARVSQDVKMLVALELVYAERHGKRKRFVADPRPILLA